MLMRGVVLFILTRNVVASFKGLQELRSYINVKISGNRELIVPLLDLNLNPIFKSLTNHSLENITNPATTKPT